MALQWHFDYACAEQFQEASISVLLISHQFEVLCRDLRQTGHHRFVNSIQQPVEVLNSARTSLSVD